MTSIGFFHDGTLRRNHVSLVLCAPDILSWTDKDTALAEALWCDSRGYSLFSGLMTLEQARHRLEAET